MKVKVKFSIDQIGAISTLLNKCYDLNFYVLTPEEKIEISIGAELSDSFDKRRRKIQKELNLLNSNKKVDVTLKFYEAWALKKIFINQIHLLENDYQKFQIQNAINILDPESVEKKSSANTNAKH